MRYSFYAALRADSSSDAICVLSFIKCDKLATELAGCADVWNGGQIDGLAVHRKPSINETD